MNNDDVLVYFVIYFHRCGLSASRCFDKLAVESEWKTTNINDQKETKIIAYDKFLC